MILLTAVFAWLWNRESRRHQSGILAPEKEGVTQFLEILFMTLSFLPMFLINGTMSYVGNDYTNYYVYYQRITSGLPQEVDVGYKAICLFCERLGLGFHGVILIFALISYTLLMLCIRKYSKNYAMSYLMFFFNGYFALLGLNQIRQFVSVVLVFYAYDYIRERKILRYMLCIVIASCFHFSALIMIPCYWILKKRWNLSAYIVVSMLFLPMMIFYKQAIYFLYSVFLPRYLNSNYVSGDLNVNIPYLLLVLITVTVYLLYSRYEEEKDPIYRNSVCISLVLALFGAWIPDYRRFIYYFFITTIVSVPGLLEHEKSKKKELLVYFVLLLVYVWYFMRSYDGWGIVPYKSVLMGM